MIKHILAWPQDECISYIINSRHRNLTSKFKFPKFQTVYIRDLIINGPLD